MICLHQITFISQKMMARASELLIDDVVFRIGAELRRSEKEVRKECDGLRKNWVTTLHDWKLLSEERKNALSLPLMLNCKIQQFVSHNLPVQEKKPCHIIYCNNNSICLNIDNNIHEFGLYEKISELSSSLGDSIKFFSKDNRPLPSELEVLYLIIPGNYVDINGVVYEFIAEYKYSAIDNWLISIKMEKYMNLFRVFGLEDFLTLPFLQESALLSMGITNNSDREIMVNAIQELCKLSRHEFVGTWMEYLGFSDIKKVFIENEIDLQSLLLLKHSDFRNKGISSEYSDSVWKVVERYKKFSSVEETFSWLQCNKFEKYSFHFARYNIPFYAIPFVNFFIINEMGVTIDDQQLLLALQQLKDSPTYDAKAVTFWLRDLEMEKYNTVFARNSFYSLNHFTTLDDKTVDKYIDNDGDREKMKIGIREMKEFQFYYTATSSLLQELGMEKYSQLFALHGISIDMLPLLTESQLMEMGVLDSSDRKRILSVMSRIKEFVPAPGN